MQKYKIIACDIDGTLCNDDWRISEENFKAMRELNKEGVFFVPATGRAFGELPSILKEEESIRYYITSNGTMVYDKKTDTRYTFGVKHDKIMQILQVLKDYTTFILLHAYGKSYYDVQNDTDEHYKTCHMTELWKEYVRSCDEKCDDFASFSTTLEEMEMMCVFVSGEDKYNECKERINALGGLRVTSSAYQNMEFFSDASGKDKALYSLADILGVDHSATIAVGDSFNDMTMVRAAGLGIAVSNAKPELKEIADMIGCSNNEHIVKYILENIIRK